MSETKGDDSTAATAKEMVKTPPEGPPPEQLTDLMASGAKAAVAGAPARGPDLDQQALRAAEAALADGERALAAARAQLAPAPAPRRSASRRELALRLLLAANVLAMIVVAALPAPGGKGAASDQPVVEAPAPHTANEPPATGPRLADKYVQAITAGENKDYGTAITLLEQYLAESPRMLPGRQLNVLTVLAYYCGLVGRFEQAREYERRVQSVAQSHSLPEDLVAMAKAAQGSGDQDQLRRVWARFLLQQRQIPSSLYQHVAEAYLQLGDSYRHEANAAAERARLRELQQTSAALRDEAGRKGGK